MNAKNATLPQHTHVTFISNRISDSEIGTYIARAYYPRNIFHRDNI